MTEPSAAEQFHRFAVARHLGRLIELSATNTDRVMSDEIRLGVADALAWSVRLHDDVLAVSCIHPMMGGIRWARHRIVHGDASLLSLAAASEVDRSYDSPDILWSDPEVTYDGAVLGSTVRFGEMPDQVPDDQNRKLRGVYNEHVAGRRVVVVCGLLRGEATFDGFFLGS